MEIWWEFGIDSLVGLTATNYNCSLVETSEFIKVLVLSAVKLIIVAGSVSPEEVRKREFVMLVTVVEHSDVMKMQKLVINPKRESKLQDIITINVWILSEFKRK